MSSSPGRFARHACLTAVTLGAGCGLAACSAGSSHPVSRHASLTPSPTGSAGSGQPPSTSATGANGAGATTIPGGGGSNGGSGGGGGGGGGATPGLGASASTTSTTTPPVASRNGTFTVASPQAGATAVSPFTVTGTAKVGVGSFELQLTDGAGNVLVQQTVRPSSGGGFSMTLRFAVAQPGPGSLILFTTSSTGARQDITQIPLQLGD